MDYRLVDGSCPGVAGQSRGKEAPPETQNIYLGPS